MEFGSLQKIKVAMRELFQAPAYLNYVNLTVGY